MGSKMSKRHHSLTDIPAVGETRKQRLREAGYDSVSDIAAAPQQELTEIHSIDPEMARCVRQGAKELVGEDWTLQHQIATDCSVSRAAVAEAFSKIAYVSGSYELKETALRELFDEDSRQSILTLDGPSLRNLFLLYEADFQTLAAVANASLEDLAEVNYFDKQRAQTIKTAAQEAREDISADVSDTDSGEASDESDPVAPGPDPAPELENSPQETPFGEASPSVSKQEAQALLEESIGPDAAFRPDQWEAIDKIVNHNDQLLLVQRTGWGKSTVYFIATALLRAQGEGPTLIISPLLSLMRNQIQNAEAGLDLDAITINSNNRDEWAAAKQAIIDGTCDVVLVSPERLATPDFQAEVLSEMEQEFGMLVVDEAHCISDWGHEFRPDYRRIKPLIERLPDSTPIAATTATANDRVVEDVTSQLPNLEPIRGTLVRDSLKIQAIEMTSREERLAWLAENVTETPYSGIIYCLTTDATETVAEWLTDQGLTVEPYHGRLDDDTRRKREQQLLDNEVDALVATNALGMGFDKPDLGFVIHFQRPPNLIRYYQEIGRAGRDLDEAYAIVLAGEDDDDIAEFFIESAFPDPEAFERVLATFEDNEEPLSTQEVHDRTDVRWNPLNKCLDMLAVEGALSTKAGGYVRTDADWSYDHDRVGTVTERRWDELGRIKDFVATDECLTRFIDDELDGDIDAPCGQCANCAGNFLPTEVRNEALIEAATGWF